MMSSTSPFMPLYDWVGRYLPTPKKERIRVHKLMLSFHCGVDLYYTTISLLFIKLLSKWWKSYRPVSPIVKKSSNSLPVLSNPPTYIVYVKQCASKTYCSIVSLQESAVYLIPF